MKDLNIPPAKSHILDRSYAEVSDIEQQYREGIITRSEKKNKVVDVWTKATNEVSEAMMRELRYDTVPNPHAGAPEAKHVLRWNASPAAEERCNSFNSVFMMANSGARGNQDQIRQLAGMRGLMAKPSGEIIETPITTSFREGLTILQYFTSTHGARKGLADTALKTANSGYLTRRLVDVVQDVIVSEHDCKTVDDIELSHVTKGGEITVRLSERVLGRVAMYDVLDPETGEVFIPANAMINEDMVTEIERRGVSTITIRSALTCKSQHGVCALCYGRDLARGHLVNVGEAVGIIAAQSIGEPGTQLTMRTFHIGGTASKEIEQSRYEAMNKGRVVLSRVRTVTNSRGERMVLGKSGQLRIVDEQGVEREKYALPSGARLYFENGAEVKKGDRLAEWDPFNEPFVTDVDGAVQLKDIIDGRTVQERIDKEIGRAHV